LRDKGEVLIKLLRGVITGGGIAAFFFFSWILQMLWNSILFEQLQVVPTQVTYWQNPSSFGKKWSKFC